jgi:hypothetical protein
VQNCVSIRTHAEFLLEVNMSKQNVTDHANNQIRSETTEDSERGGEGGAVYVESEET